jgi:hypothetical protein
MIATENLKSECREITTRTTMRKQGDVTTNVKECER